MQIQELLGYADWSKGVLQSTLEAHVEMWDKEFETISNFKSIRALTAHIAGAEERWLMGVLGQPRPNPIFEERVAGSIADVFGGWDVIRSGTHDFVSTAAPGDILVVHQISLPRWNFEADKTVEQILHHVCNHQTYHLGQISMTLQRWGIDPPNFDAILMPSNP